jgi:hypothetical protein
VCVRARARACEPVCARARATMSIWEGDGVGWREAEGEPRRGGPIEGRRSKRRRNEATEWTTGRSSGELGRKAGQTPGEEREHEGVREDPQAREQAREMGSARTLAPPRVVLLVSSPFSIASPVITYPCSAPATPCTAAQGTPPPPPLPPRGWCVVFAADGRTAGGESGDGGTTVSEQRF